MATKADDDAKYIRKIRRVKREHIINLPSKFLAENDLKEGDLIDVRNMKKVVR